MERPERELSAAIPTVAGTPAPRSATSTPAAADATGGNTSTAGAGSATSGGNRSAQRMGRVLGTEDATPPMFYVTVAEGQYLQLDDVVVTARWVPGLGR